MTLDPETPETSEDGDETTEPETPGWKRFGIPIGALVLLVTAFFGGRLIAPLLNPPKPAPAPAAAAAPAPVTNTPAPVVTKPPEPDDAAATAAAAEARAKARKKKEAPAPPAAPAAPAAPTAGELHIDSDVPGAMIFLDRKFLGNAPVVAKDVAPGQHKLNASADGYDGVSDTIDVAVGPANVTVRFKEVRLSASVAVVHKHGMGSCEGKLLADPKGIRYETTNKDDAFVLAFADIDQFEVDYLKKNLKIKKRGGKTYNFTTRAENADPLFVFHRDVDKVRKQVAGK